MFQVNATSDLILYALFPGQRILIGAYHPNKPLGNIVLSGPKTFSITIKPVFTVTLPEKSDCFTKGDDIDSIIQAERDYEKW